MKAPLLVLGLGLCLLAGCAASSVGERSGRYSAALRGGDLPRAYQITSAGYRAEVSRAQFEAQLARPGAAAARAEAVDRASAEFTAAVPELELEPGRAPRTLMEARAVLRTFVDAADAHRFSECYALLAGPLRARYTPDTLAEDYGREPLAAARVARVRAALAGSLQLTEAGAELPLGAGHAARLVREGEQLKIAALE